MAHVTSGDPRTVGVDIGTGQLCERVHIAERARLRLATGNP